MLGAHAGAVVSNAYYMPLAAVSEAELKRHRQRLTMVPIDTFRKGGGEPFEVFTLTATHLMVPRFYGLEQFGPPRTDRSERGAALATAATAFSGTLTMEQQRVVEATRLRFFGDAARVSERGDDAEASPYPRGGLLVLPCGFGKTVTALYVAAVVVRRKCLVLVHKQGLLEQWVERARQFVPHATVGVLQQDRLDEDADILIGMIQTVAKRDVAQRLKNRGLVIVDECHHIGAPVFGSALAKLRCAWCLGLSATPERKDGLTGFLFMSMGSIICRIERERETALVTSLLLDEKEGHREVLHGNGRPNYAAMVNKLTSNVERNALIASHVARVQRCGRCILVLSDRVSQLEALHSRLVGVEGVAAEAVGFYIGKSTPEERALCPERRILLSTYSMAREGMDQKHLTCLCLASPTSDLVQAVGRVQRESGRERTGPPPLIIDVCDPFSVFEHQARKRRRWYKAAGFTLQRWTASTQAVTADGGEAGALFE